MKRCGLFEILLIVAAILTDCLARGQVNVEPNTALLNEGDRTELLCRYGHSINYCRIEIPGEKVLNLSPDWNNKVPGFTYYGDGLTSGHCGVSIERVKAINNGQVKCSLGVEGEEFTGAIELVVALRPQQPIIELMTKPDRDGYFNEGSLFEARCTVHDGRPAANITWLIDEYPADKRHSELQVIPSPSNANLTLFTSVQQVQWHLAPEDNGRKLICRSHHQTDRENVPPQEGAYQLLVRYAPIRQNEALVYGLFLDHTALVNMTIRSNPAPVVEWVVDGDVIAQASQSGRFSVYEPQYIGHDMYNVTMAIAGLTLEDTTKTYMLRASNGLGQTDYQVRLSLSSTPPTAGLDIGAIVGIVVAIAVLIVIVLLIVFARATGRWCFGGKSLKTPTNETSSKDPQRYGQSVSLLETPNGVTIIGNNGARDHDNHADHDDDDIEKNGLHVQRRSHNGADDESFEYATDRESSVYNPTTVPLRSVMANAGGRNAKRQPVENGGDEGGENTDLLARGSQLGIPESRFSRWIPKDQREILEKQAKLLANRIQPKTPEPVRAATQTQTQAKTETQKTPQETEIYSDTESADFKATSVATTATTAAASDATAPATTNDNDESTTPSTTTTTTTTKKSKRFPSLTTLLKRINERDSSSKKKDNTTAPVNEDEDLRGDETTTTAGDSAEGNANEQKEDKQLVYAELVLKPAENNEPPIPPKNSTEYAEIVYVQKPNAEQSKK